MPDRDVQIKPLNPEWTGEIDSGTIIGVPFVGDRQIPLRAANVARLSFMLLSATKAGEIITIAATDGKDFRFYLPNDPKRYSSPKISRMTIPGSWVGDTVNASVNVGDGVDLNERDRAVIVEGLTLCIIHLSMKSQQNRRHIAMPKSL
jgi:hypothetical protein